MAMSEAAGFPTLVLEACRAFTAASTANKTGPSTMSNLHALVPTPSKVMKQRRHPDGATTTTVDEVDGGSGGDGDADDAFVAFALTTVRRHIAWILGDWRRGGLPTGTHAVPATRLLCEPAGGRVEPFCFWEETMPIVEHPMCSAQGHRAVMLRLWWSRREAQDAHRALCHAACRIRLLRLESVVYVPPSVVFACNGTMVSVTALTAVHPAFAHQLTAVAPAPPRGHIPCDTHAKAWAEFLMQDVLQVSAATSGASHRPNTGAGVMAVEAPIVDGGAPQPALVRLVALPAAHEVFAEEVPSVDITVHPYARGASRYLRHAQQRSQQSSELVETLVRMAMQGGADAEDVFAALPDSDQCGERCRMVSHLFHAASSNMRKIGGVRQAVLSRVHAAAASALQDGANVWRALDERLLSGCIVPLLSRVIDDTAEKTARLPTEVKVSRECEAVEACLRRMLAAPEARLPFAIEKRYGGLPFSDGAPPLHPSLLQPNSEALACLMGHCASLLGFSVSVQARNTLPGDKETPQPPEGGLDAWTVVVDRIALGGPITTAGYIGRATEIASSVAHPIPASDGSNEACFAQLVRRVVDTPTAAWEGCTSLLGGDDGASNGAAQQVGDRLACFLLLAVASASRGDGTPPERSGLPPLVVAPPPPPDIVLRGLRWLHNTFLSQATVAPAEGACASADAASAVADHDAMRCLITQVLRTLLLHFVEPLCRSAGDAPHVQPPGRDVAPDVLELACRCCLALLCQKPMQAASVEFEESTMFHLRFLRGAWERYTAGPREAAPLTDTTTHSVDGLKQKRTQATWLAVVVALMEAHMLHLLPMGDDAAGLKQMGLAFLAAVDVGAALSGLLALHTRRQQQRCSVSIARVLTQLLVELEHHTLYAVATAVATVLANWVFRLQRFPAPLVQALADAAAVFALHGAPLLSMEPMLEALNGDRRLQPHCVAAATEVLHAPCHDDRVEMNDRGAEQVCMGTLHVDGIRALVVTALVRADPSGLSASFRAASLAGAAAGLKPQRPPPSQSSNGPSHHRSGGKPPRSREPSMVELVFGRWHYFESLTARRRYAEEVLWASTVNVLGSSSTISEDDAEHYLLEFGLFGDLFIAEDMDGKAAPASGPVRFEHGGVVTALVESLEHAYQRQAVLLALLLASARCVRKFGALKPPIAARSKDAMSSVLATLVLILKRPDLLMADLDDEEPVLLGLLDVSVWLASIQRPEERCLCRAACLWIVKALLPFSSIANCCAPGVVDNVVSLFDALEAWQADPCLKEAPNFMTEGAAEAVMLLLDSFDDTTESFPAISDTSRILGRTLSGFDEVRKNLDRQWVMGPRPPPPASSRADGKKRVVSANAPRRLLTFDPMSAFLAAEESDRQTIAAEEGDAFQQDMLTEHRRVVPRLFERQLAHVSHSSNVRVPPYVDVDWSTVVARVADEVEPQHRQRLVIDEAHAWGGLLACFQASSRGELALRSPNRADLTADGDATASAAPNDPEHAEVTLRNAQWKQRALIEKESVHAYLALLAASAMEVTAMARVDTDRAFYNPRTPTPPPEAVAPSPPAVSDTDDDEPLQRQLAEPLSLSESSGRSMLEAAWKTYWGVLILDMKRCILLQRSF